MYPAPESVTISKVLRKYNTKMPSANVNESGGVDRWQVEIQVAFEVDPT